MENNSLVAELVGMREQLNATQHSSQEAERLRLIIEQNEDQMRYLNEQLETLRREAPSAAQDNHNDESSAAKSAIELIQVQDRIRRLNVKRTKYVLNSITDVRAKLKVEEIDNELHELHASASELEDDLIDTESATQRHKRRMQEMVEDEIRIKRGLDIAILQAKHARGEFLTRCYDAQCMASNTLPIDPVAVPAPPGWVEFDPAEMCALSLLEKIRQDEENPIGQ